jgi:diguanylate cyclase (GGDEF)-like protein
MSGGLLMAVGWIFKLDSRVIVGQEQMEAKVLGLVAGVGLVFLVTHYLIQGMRLVLARTTTWRGYAARMFLPGILAEASLLPLAVVVVLIYRPDRPLGFVLLGATYLLINFAFNQLSQGRARLDQRVGELETLNRTAHALAGSLQLHELIQTIARETLAAIPEAEVLALAHREANTPMGELVVDCYERDHDRFRRVHARADEGIGGAVIAQKKLIHIDDVRRTDHAGKGDPGIRSWLGVPIVIYDEAVGVLSVQSRERAAFDADAERVLEAIGAQAAVAIQNARLYELATVDGLTGLYVRRYFDARLKEELERARRFETPFSLVLLDIDNFKALNDTHGHAVGDKVLREIAQVMRRNMRGIDIPARYGGEEFAFILPRTAIVDAHAVAERIRADIADARVTTGELVLKITASLGVACWPESGEGDSLALIEKADTALYRAKATGKNRVELYWSEQEKRGLRGV